MNRVSYNTFAASFYATWYGMIRAKAREMGYAIAIHGSMVNDMDLVAIPWVEAACDPEELVETIRQLVRGYVLNNERTTNPDIKPHGRLAWQIILDAGLSIDLSVMPKESNP